MSAERVSSGGRPPVPLPAARSPANITPEMVEAGRAAFKRKRKLLDDLWQAFDVDIDVAVCDIYRSMLRANCAG